MTTDRPYRRGSYVPLSSRYWEDDAILNASMGAEVMYVRGLAYCAASMTDGFISDTQVRRLCRDVRGMRRVCVELVSLRLWERAEERGGYVVRSWLKWNPTAEDILAGQEAERQRKKRYRDRSRPAGQTPDVQPESGRKGRGRAYTDTDTDPELSPRSPTGSDRGDTAGRRVATSARGADAPPGKSSVVDDVPPVPDWRAPRTAAKPPDLSDIRAELARVAARTKAKSNMRPDAMAELRQATAVNGSHLNGDATE